MIPKIQNTKQKQNKKILCLVIELEHKIFTVNLESFIRVLLLRNFAEVKFRENKALA